MPLKVITAQGEVIEVHAPQDFENIFRIGYLSHLEFENTQVQFKVERRSDKALDKGWITPRQKWLGHYYSKGIRGAIFLDLTIVWIDSKIGYGVWTNREIPAHSFIGEYTGMIRKRRFWGRWKNLYCFDYNIGEARRTPYVIDAKDFGNYTRFINHCFEANVEPVSVYCNGLVHVILYAKQRIPAGTQLCYDYGEDYWEKRGKPENLFAALKKD